MSRSLDGFKTMRQQIPIQIQAADMSGVHGYRVSRERYQGTELSTIATNVSEDEVEAILTERDYRKFRDGSYRFRISAQLLCETFQYLA